MDNNILHVPVKFRTEISLRNSSSIWWNKA